MILPAASRRRAAVSAGLCAALVLSACAKKAEDVAAAYRSPQLYAGFDCPTLAAERLNISRKVAELSDAQDDAATRDAVAVGVGLVLFWPALFMLAAGDEKSELAHLKGEYEAIERAMTMKRCPAAMPATTVAQNVGAAPAPAAPAAQPVAASVAAAEASTMAPDPRLYEGKPLSAFSQDEIRGFCAQDWRMRVNAEGRTEFNPCHRKDAFEA